MKIIEYRLVSQAELLARLKKTRLKGFDGFEIYRTASLQLVEGIQTDLLTPPQRYVLNGGVDVILELSKLFGAKGIDIFSLTGALLFWTDGMSLNEDPIPFLPPIIEDSIERNGKKVLIVSDGMHRVCAARKLKKRINVVHASNISPNYPYYAYGFQGGWENIDWFDELPDDYQKKDYRNPDGYKQLFRLYNGVFPGVQAERKSSNPAHIKA